MSTRQNSTDVNNRVNFSPRLTRFAVYHDISGKNLNLDQIRNKYKISPDIPQDELIEELRKSSFSHMHEKEFYHKYGSTLIPPGQEIAPKEDKKPKKGNFFTGFGKGVPQGFRAFKAGTVEAGADPEAIKAKVLDFERRLDSGEIEYEDIKTELTREAANTSTSSFGLGGSYKAGLSTSLAHKTGGELLDDLIKEYNKRKVTTHETWKRYESKRPNLAKGEEWSGYGFGYNIAETITRMLPAMAAGALTGPAAVITTPAIIGGDVYGATLRESEHDGLSYKEAKNRALFRSFAEAATETIPVGFIFKPIKGAAKIAAKEKVAKEAYKGLEKLASKIKSSKASGLLDTAKDIGKAGLAEGLQESAVEIMNATYDVLHGYEDRSLGEFFNDLAYATLLGGVAGGTFRSGSMIIQKGGQTLRDKVSVPGGIPNIDPEARTDKEQNIDDIIEEAEEARSSTPENDIVKDKEISELIKEQAKEFSENVATDFHKDTSQLMENAISINDISNKDKAFDIGMELVEDESIKSKELIEIGEKLVKSATHSDENITLDENELDLLKGFLNSKYKGNEEYSGIINEIDELSKRLSVNKAERELRESQAEDESVDFAQENIEPEFIEPESTDTSPEDYLDQAREEIKDELPEEKAIAKTLLQEEDQSADTLEKRIEFIKNRLLSKDGSLRQEFIKDDDGNHIGTILRVNKKPNYRQMQYWESYGANGSFFKKHNARWKAINELAKRAGLDVKKGDRAKELNKIITSEKAEEDVFDPKTRDIVETPQEPLELTPEVEEQAEPVDTLPEVPQEEPVQEETGTGYELIDVGDGFQDVLDIESDGSIGVIQLDEESGKYSATSYSSEEPELGLFDTAEEAGGAIYEAFRQQDTGVEAQEDTYYPDDDSDILEDEYDDIDTLEDSYYEQEEDQLAEDIAEETTEEFAEDVSAQAEQQPEEVVEQVSEELDKADTELYTQEDLDKPYQKGDYEIVLLDDKVNDIVLNMAGDSPSIGQVIENDEGKYIARNPSNDEIIGTYNTKKEAADALDDFHGESVYQAEIYRRKEEVEGTAISDRVLKQYQKIDKSVQIRETTNQTKGRESYSLSTRGGHGFLLKTLNGKRFIVFNSKLRNFGTYKKQHAIDVLKDVISNPNTNTATPGEIIINEELGDEVWPTNDLYLDPKTLKKHKVIRHKEFVALNDLKKSIHDLAERAHAVKSNAASLENSKNRLIETLSETSEENAISDSERAVLEEALENITKLQDLKESSPDSVNKIRAIQRKTIEEYKDSIDKYIEKAHEELPDEVINAIKEEYTAKLNKKFYPDNFDRPSLAELLSREGEARAVDEITAEEEDLSEDMKVEDFKEREDVEIVEDEEYQESAAEEERIIDSEVAKEDVSADLEAVNQEIEDELKSEINTARPEGDYRADEISVSNEVLEHISKESGDVPIVASITVPLKDTAFMVRGQPQYNYVLGVAYYNPINNKETPFSIWLHERYQNQLKDKQFKTYEEAVAEIDRLTPVGKPLGSLLAQQDTTKTASKVGARVDTRGQESVLKTGNLLPFNANDNLTEDQKALRSAIVNNRMNAAKSLKNVISEYKDGKVSKADVDNAAKDVKVVISQLSREIVKSDNTVEQKFKDLSRLDSLVPKFSQLNQDKESYTTPPTVAYIASLLSDVGNHGLVFDGSAGYGNLVVGANQDNVTVNDTDEHSAESLKQLGFANVSNKDILNEDVVDPKSQDFVLVSPPMDKTISEETFDGTTLKRADHRIIAKSLQAMKDDGTAVVLFPTNIDRSNNKSYYDDITGYLYSNYNVVSHFIAGKSLYDKSVGTPHHVVTINGRSDDNAILKSPHQSMLETIDSKDPDALYDFIDDELEAISNEEFNVHPVVVKKGDKKNVERKEDTEELEGLKAMGSEGSSIVESRSNDNTDDVVDRAVAEGNVAEDVARDDRQTDREPVSDEAGLGAEEVSGQDSERSDNAGSRVSSDERQLGGDTVASDNTADGDTARSEREKADGDGAQGTRSEGVGVRRDSKRIDVGDSRKLSDVKLKQTHVQEGQVDYQSPSGDSQGIQTPTFLISETNIALNKLQDKVGDLRAYVRKELQYKDDAELSAALEPLQIDGTALAIEQLKKGKAMINADGTGVGKGRQAAAVMRWAMLNNKLPVFMTKGVENLTDIYIDLKNVGETNIKPFILNDNNEKSNIIDSVSKKVLYEYDWGSNKKRNEKLEKIIYNGKLPKDADNILLATYSQIDRKTSSGKRNSQRRLLESLKENNDVVFVLDESHNAAGTLSFTGSAKRGTRQLDETRTPFIAKLTADSPTLFLSATYAKRADNLYLYFRNTELNDMVGGITDQNTEEIINTLKEGGEAMKTFIVRALARDGQFIRRERSYKNRTYIQTVDKKHSADNRKQADTLADIFSDIVSIQSKFKETHQDIARKMHEAGKIQLDKTDTLVTPSVFTSTLNNYMKQILLSMKTEAASESAIKSIEKGEKPVIVLQNTMGSFFEHLINTYGFKNGDVVDIKYNEVIHRAFTNFLSLKKKAKGSRKIESMPFTIKDLPDGEFKSEVQKISDKIMSADINLDISPIDRIMQNIRNAGHSIEEMTGRKFRLDYSGDKPILRSNDINALSSMSDFNHRDLNSLIMNQKATNGISVHASKDFKSQNQRRMITIQPFDDVNNFMQAHGRVDRFNQVSPPIFETLMSDIPTELRQQSILDNKLASLSSLTTSNPNSNYSSQDVANITDLYGNRIVNNLLRENPNLASSIGMDADVQPKVNVITGNVNDLDPEYKKVIGTKIDNDISTVARKFLNNISILPVSKQEELLDLVSKEYIHNIETVDAQGINELDVSILDLKARIRSSTTRYDGVEGSSLAGDVVDHIIDVAADTYSPSPESVMEKVDAGLNKGDIAQVIIDERREIGDSYITSMQESLNDIDDFGNAADQAQINEANRLRKRIDAYVNGKQYLINLMRSNPIGTQYISHQNDGVVGLVITDIYSSNHIEGNNPWSEGSIKVNVSISNRTEQIEMSLVNFINDYINNKVDYYSNVTDRNTINKFVNDTFSPIKDNGESRDIRALSTGNLYRAIGSSGTNHGRIINFTDSDGRVHQGFLYNAQDVDESLPLNLESHADSYKKWFEDDPHAVFSSRYRSLVIKRENRSNQGLLVFSHESASGAPENIEFVGDKPTANRIKELISGKYIGRMVKGKPSYHAFFPISRINDMLEAIHDAIPNYESLSIPNNRIDSFKKSIGVEELENSAPPTFDGLNLSERSSGDVSNARIDHIKDISLEYKERQNELVKLFHRYPTQRYSQELLKTMAPVEDAYKKFDKSDPNTLWYSPQEVRRFDKYSKTKFNSLKDQYDADIQQGFIKGKSSKKDRYFRVTFKDEQAKAKWQSDLSDIHIVTANVSQSDVLVNLLKYAQKAPGFIKGDMFNTEHMPFKSRADAELFIRKAYDAYIPAIQEKELKVLEKISSATEQDPNVEASIYEDSIGQETVDGSGVAVEDIKDLVGKLNISDEYSVYIHDNVDAVPQIFRDQLSLMDSDTSTYAEAFSHKDEVHIIADRFKSIKRVEEVLAHELIGHIGFNKVVGESNWKIFRSQYRKMKRENSSAFREVHDEVKRRYDPDGTLDENTEIREFVAVMAEKRGFTASSRANTGQSGWTKLKKWFRDIREAIKRWLLKTKGFMGKPSQADKNKWTVDRINEILARGEGRVIRSKEPISFSSSNDMLGSQYDLYGQQSPIYENLKLLKDSWELLGVAKERIPNAEGFIKLHKGFNHQSSSVQNALKKMRNDILESGKKNFRVQTNTKDELLDNIKEVLDKKFSDVGFYRDGKPITKTKGQFTELSDTDLHLLQSILSHYGVSGMRLQNGSYVVFPEYENQSLPTSRDLVDISRRASPYVFGKPERANDRLRNVEDGDVREDRTYVRSSAPKLNHFLASPYSDTNIKLQKGILPSKELIQSVANIAEELKRPKFKRYLGTADEGLIVQGIQEHFSDMYSNFSRYDLSDGSVDNDWVSKKVIEYLRRNDIPGYASVSSDSVDGVDYVFADDVHLDITPEEVSDLLNGRDPLVSENPSNEDVVLELSKRVKKARQEDSVDNDPYIQRGIKRFWNKYMSINRNLPKDMAEKYMELTWSKKTDSFAMDLLVNRFNQAIKKAYGNKKLTKEQENTINDALRGRSDIKTFTKSAILRDSVAASRELIDNLSDQIVATLHIDINNLLEDVRAFPNKDDRDRAKLLIEEKKMLIDSIKQKSGNYLNTAYRAHTDKRWARNVYKLYPNVVKRAGKYLEKQYMDNFEDQRLNNPKKYKDVTDDEIRKSAEKFAVDQIASILQNSSKDKIFNKNLYRNITNQDVDPTINTRTVSVLKEKGDVPQEIRDLLGEYTDPREVVENTITKQINYLHNALIMQAFIKSYKGKLLWRSHADIPDYLKPTAASKGRSHTIQITEIDDPIFSHLQGWYIHKDIVDSIKNLENIRDPNPALDWIVVTNGYVKIDKTVLSATTQFRNFWANPLINLARGSPPLVPKDWVKGIKAINVLLNRQYDSSIKDYLLDLHRLGVLGDSVHGQQTATYIKEAKFYDMLDNVTSMIGGVSGKGAKTVAEKAVKGIKAGFNFAQRLYSYTDELFKIMGFESELRIVKKHYKDPNKTEKDYMELAAERLRPTLPRYSSVNRTVRWLARWPLNSPFPSFTAEIIRTQASVLKLIATDVEAKKYSLAMKRSASLFGAWFSHGIIKSTFWIGASLAGVNVVKQLLDASDSDEDEFLEGIKHSLPMYMQDNNPIIMDVDTDKNWITLWDFKSLDPYSYFNIPFDIMLDPDLSVEDKMWKVGGRLAEPFVMQDILFTALLEAAQGETTTGRPLWNPDKPPDAMARLLKQTGHVFSAASPGVIHNFGGMTNALQNKRRPSGQPYDFPTELLAFAGIRFQTVDLHQTLSFTGRQLKVLKRGVMRNLKELIYDTEDRIHPKPVNTGKLRDTIRSELIDYEESSIKLNKTVASALSMGMKEVDVIKSLKRIDLSEDHIGSALANRIMPLFPSERTHVNMMTYSNDRDRDVINLNFENALEIAIEENKALGFID